MAILIYQILGAFALLVLAIALPFAPAWRRGLAERLGVAGGPPARARGVRELVWVHAASVGEVRAAVPLVEALLRERPAAEILLSTFTPSGRRVAEELLRKAGPRVRFSFLPLDWLRIPGRVIRRERPSLFILLETELWPVLLTSLRREGVPVLLANGRISPRSFGRYRLLRRAMRPALEAITLALVRTPDDAGRYEALGLPANRIRMAGNLKHAARDPLRGVERVDAIRARLGAAAGRPVLVAGSLRGAESGLVLSAFRRILADVPDLLLVLAPRHPDRFDPPLLGEWGGAWVSWSAAPGAISPETRIVLLDTLGELADFYGAAQVACVGGSWVGHGGHNLLEPAFFGVPVIFGEDFSHFKEEGSALIAAGGGFCAAGADELVARCRMLLKDEAARTAAGRRAAEVAATFGGAVEKTLDAVRGLLGGPGETG